MLHELTRLPMLIQAGPIMLKSGIDVTEIITAVGDYTESVNSTKTLVQPVLKLYEQSPVIEHADEVCVLYLRLDSHSHYASRQLLDSALAVLNALKASEFAQTVDSFAQPYVDFTPFDASPFELPSVLVPPEVIELDGLTTEAGEDAQVKKEEWPAYFVRLFDNDVRPSFDRVFPCN